jgi:hypothetical protein
LRFSDNSADISHFSDACCISHPKNMGLMWKQELSFSSIDCYPTSLRSKQCFPKHDACPSIMVRKQISSPRKTDRTRKDASKLLPRNKTGASRVLRHGSSVFGHAPSWWNLKSDPVAVQPPLDTNLSQFRPRNLRHVNNVLTPPSQSSRRPFFKNAACISSLLRSNQMSTPNTGQRPCALLFLLSSPGNSRVSPPQTG